MRSRENRRFRQARQTHVGFNYTSPTRRRGTRKPRPARSAGRRRSPGLEAERHHQRPRGAAMGDRDRVGRQLAIPVGHPGLHRDIGLAARRGHRPFFGLAPGEQIGVFRLHLGQRRSLPFAIADLAQAIVDRVAGQRKLQRRRAPDPSSGGRGRADWRQSQSKTRSGHRA